MRLRLLGGYTLKINKKLPQIIIPREKLTMFMDWWDNDIRFEQSVPKAFEEGYVIYQLPTSDFTGTMAKDAIKLIAKHMGQTYREVENKLKEINNREIITYFKFLSDNRLYFERYEAGELVSKGTRMYRRKRRRTRT